MGDRNSKTGDLPMVSPLTWSHLSCGLTSRVVSPLEVLTSHVVSPLEVLTSQGFASHVVSPLKGSPLKWVHLSCGLTSQGFASHVVSPLMWVHHRTSLLVVSPIDQKYKSISAPARCAHPY